MTATTATQSPATAPAAEGRRDRPTRAELALAPPGALLVGLWILWAEHDGGYDNDTWYWGALLVLGLVGAAAVGRRGHLRLTRLQVVALLLLAANTGWSYLSMAWAASPGIALQGSNRELLYLLIFCLVLLLPWTARAATVAVGAWSGGVGVLAVDLLVRLAIGTNLGPQFLEGRLIAPTGYSNATAALFMMGLLTSVGLAARRGLPGPLRGLFLALGCADLQLALIGQSRGWLFTLPIVAVAAILVLRDRLRVVAFTLAPVLGAGIIIHRLLAVYRPSSSDLAPAAERAAQAGLLVCFGVLVVGTLLAWGDGLTRGRALPPPRRRMIGGVIAAAVLAGGVAGGAAVSHGDPVGFLVREWHGFSHEPTGATSSHFLELGSGRLDFWRVALDAFVTHPVGGLGQDNFSDYYAARGRSGEEPDWVHSLELRLLAHTGLVGFASFAAFLIAALRSALRARRRGDRGAGAVAGVALLPVCVWLVHGSIDWFWEMPALSGPALGLLGLAAALDRPAPRRPPGDSARAAPGGPRPWVRSAGGDRLAWGLGSVAALAAAVVLALPYLATRELSIASDIARRDPGAALADLHTAAELDPVNPDVPRMAGTIALLAGDDRVALDQFAAELRRRPGNWYAQFGRGLALSALGDPAAARRAFAAAVHEDRFASEAQVALADIKTRTPLRVADVRGLLHTLG